MDNLQNKIIAYALHEIEFPFEYSEYGNPIKDDDITYDALIKIYSERGLTNARMEIYFYQGDYIGHAIVKD